MKLKDIYMRDPFIFVEDGTCYLIGSTDTSPWSGKANGFLGYKSKDLINFEGPFVLFERDDSFWADENYWAPELHKIDGKYYIFASFKAAGKCRASQALVASEPFGRYKPLAKPFTPSNWECLDATYFVEKGVKYSVFCREWTQITDGEMCLGELSDDLTSLSNIKTLFKASDATWVRPYKPDGKTANFITDGPYIYKMESGTLAMIWSSLGEKGYTLGVAYSNDGINGRWQQCDTPLYVNDGGHGMIFKFKDKLYLIHHIKNTAGLDTRPFIHELKEVNNELKII
jgi:arabinan endo-1,5-alpha-L-arabinosidase